MKNIIRNTLLAVGVAGTLAIGAGAYAETAAPSAPPSRQAGGQSFSGSHARGPLARHRLRAMRRSAMRRLARRLHLDHAQRAQARQIHAKAMAAIWAARADEHLTRDQHVAQIRAAVEAGRGEFRGMLNPDQRAKLEQIESRREQRLMGL
jgi:hypothetical protein